MKKKNDHINLVLSASAGMLIFSICTFIYIYNDIFPDTEKFNADVWGTVSDWMIIAVTVVTAVFLYRTFASQQEIQKMQQKLTDIEDFKFRNELLPSFEIKGDPPIYNATDIYTKYYIFNKGKSAQNVVVRTEGKANGGDTISKEWKEKLIDSGQKLNIHQDLDKSSGDDHFEIRITIVFQDLAGNKYLQYAEIIKPSKIIQSSGERTLPSLIRKESY